MSVRSVYFDASALVKRNTPETGTPLLNALFRSLLVEQMSCSILGILEIVSVLVRKRNDGRLSDQLFSQAMLELRGEVLDNDAFTIVSTHDELLFAALPLIAQHNLNATDSIVLCSCLQQQALQPRGNQVVLWSSDKRLLRAAVREGLTVFDPEVDTMEDLLALLEG